MSEEKQEKKTLRKIKQILKWIGLGLLAFLLILALAFQAPWKVIALLAIIFLACAILSERYLKWFFLLTIAVLIAILIWLFLPDADETWRPYTFDEELADYEAKFTISEGSCRTIIRKTGALDS